jgi:hypothetical protein
MCNNLTLVTTNTSSFQSLTKNLRINSSLRIIIFFQIIADELRSLDFGEIHHGCNRVKSLRIANKGMTSVPLKMRICFVSSFKLENNISNDVPIFLTWIE